MGRTARFDREQFLRAAIRAAGRDGPAGVNVIELAAGIGAPTGSFYHRYASRSELLGDVWMTIIEDFQGGIRAGLEGADPVAAGRAAALFTPGWAQKNAHAARILTLHRSRDFESETWPGPLRSRERRGRRELRIALARYLARRFGRRVTEADATRTRFAIIDAPVGAVRPYLEEGRAIPGSVLALIGLTYDAVMK